MKQIEINGKSYNIDCNAYTQVQYKSIFKSGLLKDMQMLKEYLIKQSVVTNQIDKTDYSEAEKVTKISDYMRNDVDDFIITVTRIAWILIYTADNGIEDYETWMKSIRNFKIDDKWIVEVTEFAVDCFCGW